MCYFFTVFMLGVLHLVAQDIQTFSRKDYELRGEVKVCEVRTDYGREIFTFDREGRLVRSETVFGEEDKNVTTYQFSDGELVEKRIEHIVSGRLDKPQSFIYAYRTVYEEDGSKVVEDIQSYDSNLRERQVFEYDSLGKLTRIARSHQQGLDEILIERSRSGDTALVEFRLNKVTQRMEKSFEEYRDGKKLMHKLEVEYFQGSPFQAREEVFNEKGKRIETSHAYYNPETARFEEEEHHKFAYDKQGTLSGETIKKGASISEKGYVFQYDDHSPPNWIRKIQTPENTYVSRVITYYPEQAAEMDRKGGR